jgi:hypothetical protein
MQNSCILLISNIIIFPEISAHFYFIMAIDKAQAIKRISLSHILILVESLWSRLDLIIVKYSILICG